MKNLNSTNDLGMDSVKGCKAVAELGLSVTTEETTQLSRQWWWWWWLEVALGA